MARTQRYAGSGLPPLMSATRYVKSEALRKRSACTESDDAHRASGGADECADAMPAQGLFVRVFCLQQAGGDARVRREGLERAHLREDGEGDVARGVDRAA